MKKLPSVQQIAKLLNKHGLTKTRTERVDFETIYVGDYRIRKFNSNGIYSYILPNYSGNTSITTDDIISILRDEGIYSYELNGYVTIPFDQSKLDESISHQSIKSNLATLNRLIESQVHLRLIKMENTRLTNGRNY